MDILQVAKRAKVSTATVSRVLNGFPGVREATVARVRRAVAEMNYVPNPNARSLRVGRTRMFGLIISDINNPFFPELVDAFEALASAEKIEVLFTHTNYDPRRLHNCIRRMIERSVDAIAVMTSEVDEQALQDATKAGVPVVLMNQRKLAAKYPNVPVEYAAGFREALDHLLALGHRDIGFIAGPETLNSAVGRKEAFKTALRSHGLHVRTEWIATGDMRVEGGRTAMEKLLACNPRPTAVIASNDLMAVGALQAAHAAHVSVPKHLSIIGFDDIPIAAMVHPPLSTIRHPRREVAARAFACLQLSLQGVKVDANPPLQPHLVIRNSTAPPLGVKRARSGKHQVTS
ncbi:MAG TPA: LacI family DNA-binding transcriptional regulator [Terracidiphilus sp.]|jgi:LacI family transcriptional regulator|nr:LacI family DNA-binding transcriptional regulator [Terracidiphilus sp.]